MACNSMFFGVMVLALVCGGPKDVDTYITTYRSADATQFEAAEQAVKACAHMPNSDTVIAAMRAAGFRVDMSAPKRVEGKQYWRFTAPHAPDLSVHYVAGACTVVLDDMTPEQSHALAQPWVRAFGAKSSFMSGDRWSDQRVGSWRFYDGQRRVDIAAYKTWPAGTPEGADASRAAVRLTYAFNPRKGPTAARVIR